MADVTHGYCSPTRTRTASRPPTGGTDLLGAAAGADGALGLLPGRTRPLVTFVPLRGRGVNIKLQAAYDPTVMVKTDLITRATEAGSPELPRRQMREPGFHGRRAAGKQVARQGRAINLQPISRQPRRGPREVRPEPRSAAARRTGDRPEADGPYLRGGRREFRHPICAYGSTVNGIPASSNLLQKRSAASTGL